MKEKKSRANLVWTVVHANPESKSNKFCIIIRFVTEIEKNRKLFFQFFLLLLLFKVKNLVESISSLYIKWYTYEIQHRHQIKEEGRRRRRSKQQKHEKTQKGRM